jgi:hypothetical protein
VQDYLEDSFRNEQRYPVSYAWCATRRGSPQYLSALARAGFGLNPGAFRDPLEAFFDDLDLLRHRTIFRGAALLPVRSNGGNHELRSGSHPSAHCRALPVGGR